MNAVELVGMGVVAGWRQRTVAVVEAAQCSGKWLEMETAWW